MKHYRLLALAEDADRSEIALYQGLRAAGVDLELLLDPSAPRLAQAQEALPVVGWLRVRHRLDLTAVTALRRRLRARPPNLLYAPSNRCLSAALLATRGLPVRTIGYRGTLGHLHRFDPACRLTYSHPRLAHIVCVSDAVRDDVRRALRLPSERLTRIYKGHDPTWYESGAITPDRTGLGLPSTAFVVGCVGKLRRDKGVDVLIRALDHLPHDVHLLLVGPVVDSRLQQLATAPGRNARVHFAGPRTDVSAILGCCDAFAMPSLRREGLPRAVIEAMCRRLPPVVSNVGGMPELVEDGRCGLVVPPGEPKALADALHRLAADRSACAEMGAAARRRIVEHFHIDATISATLALHQRILS